MALQDTYDAALLDLDGTVYLGDVVIDHVPTALAAVRTAGMATLFVTNNASRPPAVVAEALQTMGIHAHPDDVFTSPMAAADLLAGAHPAGAKVLVVGAPYLQQSLVDVGLQPVELAADDPVAVVQGHSPDTGWRHLAEACIALRAGADWVACNTDATLPTDRGMLPGNGSMVAALVAATGLQPRVAGKPARPLLDSAVARSGAHRPLVVGDRLDTDVEAAVNAGLPCLMPLTGVNNAADLIAAPAHRRPTHVCLDLRGLTEPTRVVVLPDPNGRIPAGDTTPRANGSWTVTVEGHSLVLATADTDDTDDAATAPADHDHQDAAALQALAALAAAAWQQDPAPSARQIRGADPAAQAVLAALGIAAGVPADG